MRGASKGEGLGNQFLANIREVDAIIHVLRCFEDPDVTHVEGSIDPLRDAEVVETELMLADLESLEKRLNTAQKRARGGDKESVAAVALMEPLVAALQAGRPARTAIPPGQEEAVRRLQLLTSKPVLYVCNVEEASAATGNAFSARVEARAVAEGARTVVVSAAIEAEVAQLPEADRAEFLEGLGLHDSGLDRVIRAGYDLLGLVTYFTVRAEGDARLDDRHRHQGAAGGRGDPQGLRTRLHRVRDDRLRRLRCLQGRAGGEGGGQDAGGGEGIRGEGRRRAAVPLQRVDPLSFGPAVIARSGATKQSPASGARTLVRLSQEIASSLRTSQWWAGLPWLLLS